MLIGSVLAAAGNEGVNLSPLWILGAFGTAGTVIVFFFKLYLSTRDREHALLITLKDLALSEKEAAMVELERLRRGYQEMASEAINTAKTTVDYYLAKEGKPPIKLPAPVISEANSPSTQKDRELAFFATMRAAMVEINKATGQPPRVEPEPAVESAQVAVTAPPPVPQLVPHVTLLDVAGVKEAIAQVPEKTADAVVEKIEKKEKGQ